MILKKLEELEGLITVQDATKNPEQSINAMRMLNLIVEIRGLAERCNILGVNLSFIPKCTRVEVIDQNGRSYVNWKPTNKVQIQMQDGNRTLKVYIA